MKKDKNPGKQTPDFRHNPFHSLRTIKGLVSPAPPAPKQPPKPISITPGKIEDEEALFLRMVADVKRLDEAAALPETGPRAGAEQAKKAASTDEAEERTRFLEAVHKIGPVIRELPFEEQEEDLPRHSSSSRLRQLKRGTIRISEELDLHGFLREEALARLERFVFTAFDREQQAVLVITGKGINSPEGPVLQGAVAQWLRDKGRSMVAEFAPAPRDKGGSGAFVVFLRRKT
jgi:DNA-nicking Smr family endonuclease